MPGESHVLYAEVKAETANRGAVGGKGREPGARTALVSLQTGVSEPVDGFMSLESSS